MGRLRREATDYSCGVCGTRGLVAVYDEEELLGWVCLYCYTDVYVCASALDKQKHVYPVEER